MIPILLLGLVLSIPAFLVDRYVKRRLTAVLLLVSGLVLMLALFFLFQAEHAQVQDDLRAEYAGKSLAGAEQALEEQLAWQTWETGTLLAASVYGISLFYRGFRGRS